MARPFLADRKGPDKPRSRTRETLETFAVAIGLALLIRTTVAEARWIPSDSMLPTLEQGDRLIVEKISYRFESPQRGDIVVFDPPQGSGFGGGNAFIKRIIGLPGETISVSNGKVFIDGKALEPDWKLEAPDYEMPERSIPARHVFVMGDNRNNSADSHVWGALPMDNIIGRATLRFWPPHRVGSPDPPR
ncbi:MAG: signal peptidase I [Candidatus Sericytochromatia bacterium]|nr:signal peptidase I [Candidatus Sericytochromatia bacterium]